MFRFRRQLVKLIDFCLQMADAKTSNDEKQVIELKLVSLIHMIAVRKFRRFCSFFFSKFVLIEGCLPNPEKNESVLKAFAVYAIKQHKQSPANKIDQSILSIFKQAISDGIRSKEAYALAVREKIEKSFLFFILNLN